MSDHSSAELFGNIFNYLAKDPISDEALKMAKWLWSATSGYDFSAYQMDCDEALIKLGLARKGINPEYPEDGETVLYGP